MTDDDLMLENDGESAPDSKARDPKRHCTLFSRDLVRELLAHALSGPAAESRREAAALVRIGGSLPPHNNAYPMSIRLRRDDAFYLIRCARQEMTRTQWQNLLLEGNICRMMRKVAELGDETLLDL